MGTQERLGVFLVALGTQRLHILGEDALVAGAVGNMAGEASVLLFCRGMDYSPLPIPGHVLVAIEAQQRHLPQKESLVGRGVGAVAPGTVEECHWLVTEFGPLHLSLHVPVTDKAKGARTGLQQERLIP